MNNNMVLLSRLERVVKHFNCVKELMLKNYNLTVSEFNALVELYPNKELPMQSLCKKLQLKSGSMTYVIDKLAKKKLINRFQHGDDKRFYYISLTNIGYELADKLYPRYQDFINNILETDNKDTQRIIMQFLQQTLAKINCYECES
jgi:MarR family transcriptional regulator, 2-MHQ and catechol-resistance regulon repressor